MFSDRRRSLCISRPWRTCWLRIRRKKNVSGGSALEVVPRDSVCWRFWKGKNIDILAAFGNSWINHDRSWILLECHSWFEPSNGWKACPDMRKHRNSKGTFSGQNTCEPRERSCVAALSRDSEQCLFVPNVSCVYFFGLLNQEETLKKHEETQKTACGSIRGPVEMPDLEIFEDEVREPPTNFRGEVHEQPGDHHNHNILAVYCCNAKFVLINRPPKVRSVLQLINCNSVCVCVFRVAISIHVSDFGLWGHLGFPGEIVHIILRST